MKSQADMIITATELLDDEEGRDAGLVMVTAEAIHDDAVCSVRFLGNVEDGWCIAHNVGVIVYWKSEDPADDNADHTLNRGFSAEELSPDLFTDDTVNGAKFVEGGEAS